MAGVINRGRVEKDCMESLQDYKPHRPPKLLRIKVSFRNSSSEIYFEIICYVFFFSFSPNDRLYRKH